MMLEKLDLDYNNVVLEKIRIFQIILSIPRKAGPAISDRDLRHPEAFNQVFGVRKIYLLNCQLKQLKAALSIKLP